LHGYEDVAKNPRAYIGVVTGSPQHGFAIAAGVPASRVRLLSAPGSGVASLVSGVIDAFASDALSVQRLVDQSPRDSIERALPFRGPMVDGHEVKHYGAFGFREGDVGLAREFNTRLRQFIGTPEHLALVRPFGITPADIPEKGVTAKMICRHGHPVSPDKLATAR
jgi:polar amino acid transport system substrate-binding protein